MTSRTGHQRAVREFGRRKDASVPMYGGKWRLNLVRVRSVHGHSRRDTSCWKTPIQSCAQLSPDRIQPPSEPIVPPYEQTRKTPSNPPFCTSSTFIKERGEHLEHRWTFVDAPITLNFSPFVPTAYPPRLLKAIHLQLLYPISPLFPNTVALCFCARPHFPLQQLEMAAKGEAVAFNAIIQAEREKKKNQLLADKIFGSGKRSSLPGTGNGNGRKAPTGPATLASRVGITKPSAGPKQNPSRFPTSFKQVAKGGKANNQQRSVSTPQLNRRNQILTNAITGGGNAPHNLRDQVRPDSPAYAMMKAGPRTQGGINIRGMGETTTHTIIAQNFAPGTTAADIEAVLAPDPVEDGLVQCRLVASNPTVIAELVFSKLSTANSIIATFNNKKADGRLLHVYLQTPTPDVRRGRAAPTSAPTPAPAPMKSIDADMMDVEETRAYEDRRRTQEKAYTPPRGGRAQPAIQDGRYGFEDNTQSSEASYQDDRRQPHYGRRGGARGGSDRGSDRHERSRYASNPIAMASLSPRRPRSRSLARDSPARSPRRSLSPRSDSRSRSRLRSLTPRSPRRNGRTRSPSVSRSRSRGRESSRSVSRSRSRSRDLSFPRSAKIVVEQITKNVNRDHLQEIFGTYGTILDIDLAVSKTFRNQNGGLAYILYKNTEDAQLAISHMHEAQIDGVKITLLGAALTEEEVEAVEEIASAHQIEVQGELGTVDVVDHLGEETPTIPRVMALPVANEATHEAGAGARPDAVADTTLAVHHTAALLRQDAVAMGGGTAHLEKLEDEDTLVDAAAEDAAEAEATAAVAVAGHTLAAEAGSMAVGDDKREESLRSQDEGPFKPSILELPQQSEQVERKSGRACASQSSVGLGEKRKRFWNLVAQWLTDYNENLVPVPRLSIIYIMAGLAKARIFALPYRGKLYRTTLLAAGSIPALVLGAPIQSGSLIRFGNIDTLDSPLSPQSSKRSASDVYRMYTGTGQSTSWPSMNQWVSSFDEMFAINTGVINGGCAQFNVAANSARETLDIATAVKTVATESGVDSRFILAIMLQESNGCVRAPTTNYGVRNPGLMQDHDGSATCNEAGRVRNPCPAPSILKMIGEGVVGTPAGDGLVQTMAKAQGYGTSSSKYYVSARIYNSGSLAADGDLGGGVATHCYVSDVANRLTGWVYARKACSLD
ncbi:hypothetical protein FKW77_008483 [Venturia effusa]|uniref:RRM domain-containing protein n=1 Tax=Venturia effusa TaxID=50376 RepID=A0A517LJK8_9PEZI|nr:hypothetical protein FKW77_008483 [Venturia effusa]